jgi:hypothetical protein
MGQDIGLTIQTLARGFRGRVSLQQSTAENFVRAFEISRQTGVDSLLKPPR